MLNRSDAISLIQEKVPNENLCKHMIAVGAILKGMALRFQGDPHLWELTGILHDIDLGTTEDPSVHGILGAEWLEEMGMPKSIVNAVKAHAGHRECISPLDILLLAGDQLSGLITACALVKGRKLENVTSKTVQKRFKEKRFAAGANRDAIRMCEKLGISLNDFIESSLTAMYSVADELGL
ncbi:HDIG domain-containing protein [bacterium]|nr:HDIG domain-containing protein [bacterium]